MERLRELALALTLSRKRERGKIACLRENARLFPLSRLRERVRARAIPVHRFSGAKS
jgi:hypothetical protein